MKINRAKLAALATVAGWVIFSLVPLSFAVINQPARIGGTLTVNGVQITQATDDGYVVVVTDTSGTPFQDVQGEDAQDDDGLNSFNYYIVDIPIFDASDQPQGAKPGSAAVIHVYLNGQQLAVKSPSGGSLTVPEMGTINTINLVVETTQSPIADAGPDQTVLEGVLVELDGSNSIDPDGTIVSYLWEQIAGPSVELSSTTAPEPTFTAPNVDVGGAVLTFQLTVTDNEGLESADSCTVTVTPATEAKANLTPYKPSGWSDKIVVSNKTGTTTDGSPLLTTDTLYVDWAVLNMGTAATGVTFWYDLFIDGVITESWYTDVPVNPDVYVTVLDYSIGSLAAGSHSIKIVADSTNVIDENNEGDNEYTKTFTVTTPAPTPPGKATLVSPSSSISTNKPTYVWNAVSTAEQYLLSVYDSTGAWPINTWYTAAQAGCSSGTGTCSINPGVTLPPGNSTWYIQTKNSAGTGPWSDPMAFKVSMKATLTSPSGSISTNQPVYTWNAVASADWYLLAVNDSTGAWPINTWYTAAQAGCSSGTGTCSINPGVTLPAGDSTWYIQTYSSSYHIGEWSDPKAFKVVSLTPGKATLISPSGTISTHQPDYIWNAVENAEYYLVAVKDSSGTWPVNQWYSATELGCGSGTGTCSVNPGIALATGDGTWFIETWNSYGFGDWSDPKAFKVAAQKPGTASLVSPSGISTNKPTFTWNAVSNADYYLLVVKDSSGAWPVNKWYSASESDCSSGTGTCWLNPGIALAAGSLNWYIQTWNSSGLGDFSSPMTFTVPSLKPGKATLISPSGTIGTNKPTYSWNAVSNSDYYLLAVQDSSGTWPINQWYRATELGCGSGTGTCSINPGIALASGNCSWYIETANYLGFGRWSDPLAFIVP